MPVPKAAPAPVITLEELVEKATELGYLHVYQSEVFNGRWHAKITFHTKAKIKLEAASGFDWPTLPLALEAAIERAEEIRKEFK